MFEWDDFKYPKSQYRLEQYNEKYRDFKWIPGWKRDLSDKTFADYKRYYNKWRENQVKKSIIKLPWGKRRSHAYRKLKYHPTKKPYNAVIYYKNK